MTENEEKYHVPLFNGDNYGNWRFRMEVLLDEKNLMEFVREDVTSKLQAETTGESETQKKTRLEANQKLSQRDKFCKRLIISSISDTHLEYCKGKDTSYELWQSLESVFERKGVACQLRVRKNLLILKHNPHSETLEKHFLNFDRLVRDLKAAGGNMEEMDIICHLLLTMPVDYNMVVTAIETLSTDNLTLAFVKGRLLDEETKRSVKKPRNDSSASFYTSKPHYYDKAKMQPSKKFNQLQSSKYKCHNCGGSGHFRKDCPSPKVQRPIKADIACSAETSDEEFPSDGPYVFLTSTAQSVACCVSTLKFEWWLDSGASEHMVSKSDYVQNIEKITPIKIQVAKSGVSLTANEKGKIILYNSEGKSITFTDVLIVPGLHVNLLSVQKLESKGLTIVFKNGAATIFKSDNVVATALRTNKLYKLVLSTSKSETATLSTESQELWHMRYGHIGNSNLQKLGSLVDGFREEVPKSLCEPCVEGKSRKLPHNETRKRATRPLELVHSDIFGPVTPESYDGKRYVLTFIDDFTHFTAAYPIEKKSEAFHYFKIYEAMATAHFQNKICRFRCDRGGEYVSSNLKSYFQEKGIQIEYTIAYTPEQNGVAERMNRTIVEKARCMLLSSGLSKSLWSEAVKTAVYLINRSPTSALEQAVPATLWYGHRPDISKIRIFGSIVYLHKPKQISKGKFDNKSRKLFLVGYCPNGYRLWCPINQEIVEGRDVLFDETSMYKKKTMVDVNINDISGSSDSMTIQEESTSSGGDSDQNNEVSENIDSTQSQDNFDKENSDASNQELRRGTRERKPPQHLHDYEVYNDEDSDGNLALFNEVSRCEYALNIASEIDVPNSIADLKDREDSNKWMQAVEEELDALKENDTWTVTKLPAGKKAINSKWVFRVKPDANGNVDKYKARLVVKGCSQKEGIDYSETYAPVASLVTVRTLLAFINQHGLLAEQLDVKNAFLHGSIKEEIYIKVPDGLKIEQTCKEPMVCKLNKSLYGLKQAPMEWNSRFDTFIQAKDFKQTLSDKCLYINNTCGTILLLYVDDIILTGSSQETLNKWKSTLKSEFKMSDLGPLNLFLGIKIDRTKDGMYLTQSQYILNILKRFGMENCNAASTPLELDPSQEVNGECILGIKPYRELIGCLSYLSLTTRPDISVAVNFYSRFQSNATNTQWIGLKRILRYLKGTMEVGLFFKQKSDVPTLVGYADADFAGKTTVDKKSTSGYLFELYGNIVLWTTKKQTAVAQSSTEAEYVSLGTAVMSLIWLRRLILELGGVIKGSVRIYEDNQSTIHCLKRWEEKRLRHVDTKYHIVKDMYKKGIIDVIYIPSSNQKADVLTKPLGGSKFKIMCKNIGLVNFS